MNRGYGKWVLLGAMLCCLNAPMAIAGPQQDTEAAESAYRKGDLMGALALWKKAAEAGYAPAQVRLASALDDAQQDEEAVQWYRKATEQGSVAGEYGLGMMYLKGEGIAKDNEKARFHILRAANQNFVPALRTMFELYKAGGGGLPADQAEAAKWEDRMYAVTGQSRPVPAPTPKGEKKK